MEEHLEEIVEHIATSTAEQVREIASESEAMARKHYDEEEHDYPFGAYFSGYILQRLVLEIQEELETDEK